MDEKSGWKKFELKKRSRKIKTHARRLEKATTKHAHRFLVKSGIKSGSTLAYILLVSWRRHTDSYSWRADDMVSKSYVTTASVPGGTYAEAIKSGAIFEPAFC